MNFLFLLLSIAVSISLVMSFSSNFRHQMVRVTRVSRKMHFCSGARDLSILTSPPAFLGNPAFKRSRTFNANAQGFGANDSKGLSTMAGSSASANPLQDIFDKLKGIVDLKEAVIHPENSVILSNCMAQMSEVSLEDVGLTPSDIERSKNALCFDIAKISSRFHMAIFLIPAGGTLPIHDHPGMAVASKVLFGELSLKAFNKAKGFGREKDKEGEYSTVNDGEVFELVSDTTKGVSDGAWVLSASEGNIHEFAAETATLVLDILLPPYSEEEGRACTYYKPVKIAGEKYISEDEDVVCLAVGENVVLDAYPSFYMPPTILYNANKFYKGFKVNER